MITYYYSIIKESEYKYDIAKVVSKFVYLQDLSNYHIILAVESREVIGFIIFNYNSYNCMIHYIYVDYKYRNKGIGSCLLENIQLHTPPKYHYTISLPLYENNEHHLVSFFKKNKFKCEGNDCSGFWVKTKEWECNVIHRLKKIALASDIFLISGDSITVSQKKDIETIIKAYNIPLYFCPDNNCCIYRKNTFFFNNFGEIVGWTIITFKNIHTIEFDCTYVLKQFRCLKTVCNIWLLMSNEILNKYSNITNLFFYSEKNNHKLDNFYMFFLNNCQYNHFQRAVFKL